MNNSPTAAPTASSAVTNYLAAIGRKGGASGTGKSKARSKSQARKAALARWAKRKPKAEASRANGKLGGRPKKQKRTARRQNNVLGRARGGRGDANEMESGT